MNTQTIIIQGISPSGKSTLAQELALVAPEALVHEQVASSFDANRIKEWVKVIIIEECTGKEQINSINKKIKRLIDSGVITPLRVIYISTNPVV